LAEIPGAREPRLTPSKETCQLEQGNLPINASQSGIEPGTSCTAGEHSMQRAIRTALLTAIRNLGLYYYNIRYMGLANYGASE
jgi:hypothetical protein